MTRQSEIKYILQEFKSFINHLDNLIETLKIKYQREFACKPGCSDCCYAYFDVSYLEAIYISESIKDIITPQLKDKACQYREQYLSQEKLHPNRRRIKCPFLNTENLCLIYEVRPINCRIYGLPVSYNDISHVCGLSKFEKRKTYDTIKMDKIQQHVYLLMRKIDLSEDFTKRFRLDELILEFIRS